MYYSKDFHTVIAISWKINHGWFTSQYLAIKRHMIVFALCEVLNINNKIVSYRQFRNTLLNFHFLYMPRTYITHICINYIYLYIYIYIDVYTYIQRNVSTLLGCHKWLTFFGANTVRQTCSPKGLQSIVGRDCVDVTVFTVILDGSKRGNVPWWPYHIYLWWHKLACGKF